MSASLGYGRQTTQVLQIRAAFRDLLDLKLSEFTTSRLERWRVTRKFHHAGAEAPQNAGRGK